MVDFKEDLFQSEIIVVLNIIIIISGSSSSSSVMIIITYHRYVINISLIIITSPVSLVL